MERDNGLDYLLSLHGSTVYRDDGYWWKIEVWEVKPMSFIPHGIRYSLTLHDKYNTRVFGMDNAHGIKLPKKAIIQEELCMTISIAHPTIKVIPMSLYRQASLLKTFSSKWMKSSQYEKTEVNT